MHYDIAIIGGGPGGSTTGSLLKKYNPDLNIIIIERENFPRDHVGESQLPAIGKILNEMGAWEKVDGAGFPIKIGASYTWGQTSDPWEFEFLPLSQVRGDEPRPAEYKGWRVNTALQVDRAVYDDILLRHAADMGCEVRQGTAISSVIPDKDRVGYLQLKSGESITADYYVDASGNAAILRRAMGIKIDAPTKLQNIAFWHYWDGAAPANDNLGHGITRVQVRSLKHGWIWYIPLSESRVSVGFICPLSYYKSCKKRPQELYDEALNELPDIQMLLKDAHCQGDIQSTNDWSYVSEQAAGKNWFLVGEAMGFADPILAAGLTLTQSCAQHCAYTLLELVRGEQPSDWLIEQYNELQKTRVLQHMRFAEYWYSANGCFSDIQNYCTDIAQDAGLSLSPQEAFRWLSTGGFDDVAGQSVIGGYDVASLKQVQHRLSDKDEQVEYLINGKNQFSLNLANTEKTKAPILKEGRILMVEKYVRNGQNLVVSGLHQLLLLALEESTEIEKIIPFIQQVLSNSVPADQLQFVFGQTMQTLEAMATSGWVECSHVAGKPALNMDTPREGVLIYTTAMRA